MVAVVAEVVSPLFSLVEVSGAAVAVGVAAQAPSPKADKVIPAKEPVLKKFRLFIRLDFVERYFIWRENEKLLSGLFPEIGP